MSAALLLGGAGQEDRISKSFPGGSWHAASLAPPRFSNQHPIGEKMQTRFLLDGTFARPAIRKDVGSRLAGQRSVAAVFRPAEMPPHPAPACGIGPTLDAEVAHTTAMHQDVSAKTLRKSAIKECIDACEWLLFLMFYVA